MAKNTGTKVTDTTVSADEGLEIGVSEFPAYWEPNEGERFTAYPVSVDVRDPDFQRVIFRATHPVPCFRGPKDDQEEVTVDAGDLFSVSLYRAFQGQIEEYIAMGLMNEIPLIVTAIEKLPQARDKKKTYWKFSIKVPTASVDTYKARVLEYTKATRAALKAAKSGEIVQG